MRARDVRGSPYFEILHNPCELRETKSKKKYLQLSICE